MIIFDKCKYVTEIMRNGIKENESRANAKLFLVAKYLIQETQYKKGVIKKNLKKYSEDYFRGLTDEMINREIDNLYDRACKSSVVEVEKQGTGDTIDEAKTDEVKDTEIDFIDAVQYFKPRYINLYENELHKISELDDKLQELAFAFLVVNKFVGYKWTYECNSDIYTICHWEKGKGKSGTVKNKLIHSLVQNGIIRFFCNVNTTYKHNQKWIAKTSFTVLINEDNLPEDKEKSPVWKTITNYDDVLLYWRLYKGDTSIKLCEECSAPIEITGNSKKFCSNCALNKIRESKRRNKEMASQMVS